MALWGNGADVNGTAGNLQDLWAYDGTNWIWVGGTELANQEGVYGSLGASSGAFLPGSRRGLAPAPVDSNGNVYIFGGLGYNTGASGNLNDLWKYSPASP